MLAGDWYRVVEDELLIFFSSYFPDEVAADVKVLVGGYFSAKGDGYMFDGGWGFVESACENLSWFFVFILIELHIWFVLGLSIVVGVEFVVDRF